MPPDDGKAVEVRAPVRGRSLTLFNRRQLKRSEVIARDLVAYIVEARLPAGSKLPVEREMIEQIGVGRTTVREALRILETRGVLTIRPGPGGGPTVRRPEPGDLKDALMLILQFERATMAEVFDAGIWLEPVAARMAAAKITDTELARLRELNSEMEETIKSTEDTITSADQDFHRVIAGATANLVVQVFCDSLMMVADSGVADVAQSTEFKRSAVRGHQEIIEALEAKDPGRAEEAMCRHVTDGQARRAKENRDLLSRPLRWAP